MLLRNERSVQLGLKSSLWLLCRSPGKVYCKKGCIPQLTELHIFTTLLLISLTAYFLHLEVCTHCLFLCSTFQLCPHGILHSLHLLLFLPWITRLCAHRYLNPSTTSVLHLWTHALLLLGFSSSLFLKLYSSSPRLLAHKLLLAHSHECASWQANLSPTFSFNSESS